MLSAWKVCCVGISQRWIFAMMSFFGLLIGNGLRVMLSITITEMVSPVAEIARPTDEACVNSAERIFRNVSTQTNRVYDWDEYTQGIILSSYFWGYAATQFPFGAMSERFGGKHLLGYGVLVPSILTFATPMAIELGEATALIGLRVLMGVASGATYPAASTMISRWAAPTERTKLGSFVFAGGICGTMFGTTLPALIISQTRLGWPGVFYVFGALGLVWFPLWLALCYNAPEQHPYISERELGQLGQGPAKGSRRRSPPWRHILRSRSFWAFALGMVGADWAYFTVASDLPKYMSSVVGLSIEDNGYLSSLPYLTMWLNIAASSWAIDRILRADWLSLTNARKLFASLSLTGPACFIMAASYAGCRQDLVVGMFVLGMTLMGSMHPSIMVNSLDLSPNYAGTLMAIGNGMAAIGGVFAPYIVGVFTPNQTLTEWRQVFWIGFVVALLTNVYYVLFASGDVQDWDDADFDRKQTKPDKLGKLESQPPPEPTCCPPADKPTKFKFDEVDKF